MSDCTGTQAQEFGLAYVDGTLDEAQANHFEQHYFEWQLCHEQVRSLIALRDELHERSAQSPAHEAKRKSIFRLSQYAWLVAGACLLIVAGVFLYHGHQLNNESSDLAVNGAAPAPGHTSTAQTGPANATAPAKVEQKSSTVVDVTQLADLVMPVYSPHTLRGENVDAKMTSGMAAYQRGDYGTAAAELGQVRAGSEDSRAAHFYRGVSQLHIGELDAAHATLLTVAYAGESPEQEGALYALAQVALAQNNPTLAQSYLAKTIALQGALEKKAREQSARLATLQKNHNN